MKIKIKIKKKTLIIAAAVLVLIFGAGSVVALLRSGQSETALKENQSYVYAYVTDITGNEITYSVLDEDIVTAYLEQQEEAEAESDERGTPSAGDTPSTGGAPDMGEMPDMGDTPSAGGAPDMGEMPDMGEVPDNDSDREGRKSTQTIIALIPVGTTVHTQSDTATTFQRLASGDMIKLLVETTDEGEEVITEIWML